jgi:hypothetical protein
MDICFREGTEELGMNGEGEGEGHRAKGKGGGGRGWGNGEGGGGKEKKRNEGRRRGEVGSGKREGGRRNTCLININE